ncbi:MAG: hypothetical protein U0838_16330 [Chloroflexota bacterium]
MGVFAPIGLLLAARLGARWAIAAAAGWVAIAGLVRAVVPGETAILVVTLAIGFGTAVAGPMLAMFVRGAMPSLRVAGTAAYAGGTTLGQALAAGIVVPAAVLLGGWRPSLALVSALSGARRPRVASSRRPRMPRRERRERALAGRLSLPVRRLVVWALGLLFGIQSAVFYGTNAWPLSFYIERADRGRGRRAAVRLELRRVRVDHRGAARLRRGVERRQLLTTAAGSVVVGISGVVLSSVFAWAHGRSCSGRALASCSRWCSPCPPTSPATPRARAGLRR